jgi:hypothetical protein
LRVTIISSEKETFEPALPGRYPKVTAGKEKAKAPTTALPTDKAFRVSTKKVPRMVKVRDDIDPDYAEKAEDFFYGEGG